MSDTQGKWSASIDVKKGTSSLFVIHAVLLKNGHVLWFSGHVELANYPPESWDWDPTTNIDQARQIPFPSDTDIFCCHHVVLEDGKVLTAGGAAVHPNHGCGIASICVFNTDSPGWEKIGDMKEARWYPTLVTLPDGRLVAFSGHLDHDPARPDGIPRQFPPGIAATVELFKPPFKRPYQTQSLSPGGDKVLHIYPGLHLVKGGKIFYSGTTWRYEPMLGGPGAGTPIDTFSFQVTGTTGTWTPEGIRPSVNRREEGTSILLPPAQDGKILLLGGCRAIGHANTFTGLEPGSDPLSAEILNTQGSPTWTPAGPAGKMNFPRINASAVLLPDATVFIVGGHNQHKWAPSSQSAFSNTPEIYDPVANTFTSMARMNDPRTYHSACLLLPDGRVVCAGGVDPNRPETVTPPTMPGDPPASPIPIPLNQKTMEFYEPTYLFKKPQPTITNVISEGGLTIRYDGDFVIETPDADKIDKVVLMRPGAMTHHTDTEQRYVTLEITSREKGKLKVKVLNDPTVAPPGFYMLWIVDNRQVPCERARFIRLTTKAIKPKVAKCDFSKGEVETLIAAAGRARFDDAFEIELINFLPDELGIETATPTPVQLAAIAPTITFTREDGTVVPELSASPQRMILGDSTLPADKPQFVTIPYAVEFSGFPAFPPTDDPNAIKKQVIRLTARKGDFTGEDEITLFDDSFQRVIVKLRRTTGDQFVSTKEIELIDTCDSREETDTTVFVSAIRGGSLRAKLATMTDKVDVDV